MNVIIAICVLVLIAYVFDLTSSLTKIPSVILLLLLGWGVRQITNFLGYNFTELSSVLPILGTIGLILIVLEGALELELNQSKLKLVMKSFFGALLPILAIAFSLVYIFRETETVSGRLSLLNALPLCIISSAIAIPSVRNLNKNMKEYVIYESSLSDIIGVILFNYIAMNEYINSESILTFLVQLIGMVIISLISTLGLSFLLSKIEHHIKFIPIILLIILIYAISKLYHLPALLFILIFGLSLGNMDELRRFKWLKVFHTEELDSEVHKFKELTVEATFLIRTMFFILFGYLMETSDILNTHTFPLALLITSFIFLYRAVQLKLSGLPFRPLLFIAPRGLITILLFLSIEPSQRILSVNNSLIIQVIILTAIIMMMGIMLSPKTQAAE